MMYYEDYTVIPNSTLDFSDEYYINKLKNHVNAIGLMSYGSFVIKFKSKSDFVDLLKIMSRNSKIPFDIYRATWNENQKMDWTEVLTKQQIGRAFNLIEDSKLLNLDM